MPLYRFRNSILLFVHIPKCGGTSCEKMLQNAGGIQSFKAVGASSPLPCSPQHFHGELLKRLLKPKFYDYAFTVVRNPYDRLVSEYKMRVTSRAKSIEFNQWVHQTSAEFATNPFVYDNHIRPQSEFLFEGVATFKFEDGLKNAIKTVLENIRASAGDIVERHKNPSEPVSLVVSPETIDLVSSFYADDFKAFNYSTDPVRTAFAPR